MHIRCGYEISYQNDQYTPMMLMLSVHPSRAADLLTPGSSASNPPTSVTQLPRLVRKHAATHHRAPRPLTISTDFTDPRQRPARRWSPRTPAARGRGPARRGAGSSCSAAATARPTSCPTSPGRCSARPRRAGRGCRRSATTCTTASRFGYQHARADPHGVRRLSRSDAASAATSPIWRSRSAAA